MIIRRMFTTPAFRWKSPYDELDEMRGRLAHLARALSGEPESRPDAGVYPLINVTEDKDHFWIRAELPGIKADDLDLSITDNHLSLSGERKIPDAGASAKWHRREREAGKFSRMIELPDRVDPEKVKAGIADGVLSIMLPKAASAKPRQIKVS
ncbi:MULTISPECIES: Hsp20/alpha crystallin family protein [Desulfococcus]|jgi:HSP20 family protein|uniref:Heat shock protein Hsp20 n=1 Tax=Desulfococcus multivorans DSM 2059 TaxID=1121405 RepID=S7TPN9_DESML|nr:Hsp20/alpha crystallin family protein [Desulfococcus multivorans]AOY60261.1 Hsp20/alpha crystallin family protein [Desulfococcus multivorans]AQV02372.1 heat-shock protein Hsp20 [Desulfococcus multivorans]EPR39187.1 heat shock protein Hsp20 [Desulfococcus multivorans DSM 2059]SJZ57200.1 HSP20 family protein [Desulfococcus multivorans DSM 2059]